MLDKIFDDQIALSLRQLEDLWQRADTLPQPTEEPASQTEDHATQHRTLLAESLGELSRTIEELQVAVEELREQNNELSKYRQEADVEPYRYREFFELAPNACFITTKDGSVREANRAASELLGVSQKNLVSKPLILFAAPEERRKLSAALVRLKRGESQLNWQLRLDNPQGRVFTVSVNAIPVKDERGEVRRLCLWMQELPEEIQVTREGNGAVAPLPPALPIEQLGDMFNEVLSCASDLFFICDRTGKCLYVNRTTTQALGIGQQEFVGKTWQQLPLPTEAMESLEQGWKCALETGDCANAEISLPREQELRDYECAIAPLGDKEEEFQAIFIAAKDITAQKREILDATEALTKEQGLNALQIHFAHVVSHELRNPLNNIYSCAKLVENYAQHWTEEKKNTYLNRIQINVKRINRLLDDLLLMRKVEAGELKLQLALVNLDEFCRELISEIQDGKGTQHQITFVSPNHPVGIWDEKLLRQILTNLLLNAIKYSPKGSEVKLSLTAQSEAVIFCIQDRGIGIPETEQDAVFEPFHRGSNVGNVSGSGLGLSIVKQCVVLQGGKITVESTEGTGTTFTVTLPLHQGRVKKLS